MAIPLSKNSARKSSRERIGKSSSKISATLDGIAAVSRVRIAKADNFGLWPQSAATLDALLCMQIKSCLPFSNSNPQFLPYSLERSNSVIAPFGNSSFNRILAPVALVST